MDKQTEQRIIETTTHLLNQHGLSHWKVQFGTAYTQLGSCNYKTQTLRFSKRFAAVQSWEDIYDTILHEVAHAIAGYDAGHGYTWRRIARDLGLANPTSGVRTNIKFEKPWVGTCPNGHTTTMARAPQRVRSCTKSSCGNGAFNAKYIFEWKKNGAKTVMPIKYARELSYYQAQRELVTA